MRGVLVGLPCEFMSSEMFPFAVCKPPLWYERELPGCVVLLLGRACSVA